MTRLLVASANGWILRNYIDKNLTIVTSIIRVRFCGSAAHNVLSDNGLLLCPLSLLSLSKSCVFIKFNLTMVSLRLTKSACEM